MFVHAFFSESFCDSFGLRISFELKVEISSEASNVPCMETLSDPELLKGAFDSPCLCSLITATVDEEQIYIEVDGELP